MMTAESASVSVCGRVSAFNHAPANANTSAPAHTGTVTSQSMLRLRWYRTVPMIPVKMKVKSAVAIASRTPRPPNAASAGMSRIPPMPTAPISAPTANALINSRTKASIGSADHAARDARAGVPGRVGFQVVGLCVHDDAAADDAVRGVPAHRHAVDDHFD